MNLVMLCHLFNHTNETEQLHLDTNYSAFHLNKDQKAKSHTSHHTSAVQHTQQQASFFSRRDPAFLALSYQGRATQSILLKPPTSASRLPACVWASGISGSGMAPWFGEVSIGSPKRFRGQEISDF